MAEIIRQCDQLGVPHPVVSQPMYNLAMRMPENDMLPACEYFGIGVAPFSPLARGVLTGKYDPAKPPPASSRAGRGTTPAEFAVLWVLNNRIVTSVIAGPRTITQWKAYIGALAHEFTPEDEALVDSLVAAGHPAAPGLNWMRHPPRGRRTG